MEYTAILEAIRLAIKPRLPATHQAMLFGSFAKGNAIDTSDIDIAIEGPEPLPARLFFQLTDEIEKIPTLRKIDLVDLQQAGAEFRNEVLSHAKPL